MQVLEKILEEIDKLKEKCLLSEFESGYAAGALDMANAIKDVIYKCGSDNDSWILVNERLPEEIPGRYYPEMIVTTSRGDVKWGFYRTIDKEWYVYSELLNKFVEVEAKEVIAWRPLPEPYNPEEPKPAKNTQQELEDFWRDK